MRDKNRINELLDLINQIWQKDPDLRFNQLIYNLQSGYSHINNNYGKVSEPQSDGFDLYSLEDEDFIAYLRSVAGC